MISRQFAPMRGAKHLSIFDHNRADPWVRPAILCDALSRLVDTRNKREELNAKAAAHVVALQRVVDRKPTALKH